MINFINNFNFSEIKEEIREQSIKTIGLTSLSAICAYGGTFFFTRYQPLTGAIYLGKVTLISYVSYQILEKFKNFLEADRTKYMFTAIQLFQIPIAFYFFGTRDLHLSAAAKLEILIATAHFVATPVFFHLGLKAWNDPTFENVATATGVMLSLANGLRNYV